MFKQKETLVILWMTFFTVVVWIGLSIYHIWATSTIDSIDASAIVPINPRFDTTTLNKLKNREVVEPLYEFNTSAFPVSPTPDEAEEPAFPTSSPTPIPSPTPTPAPVLEEPTIFIPAPEVSELPVPEDYYYPELIEEP